MTKPPWPVLVALLIAFSAFPAFAGRPITVDDTMKYRNITHVEIAPDGKAGGDRGL